MADTVIESFLVRLGFQINQGQAKAMGDALSGTIGGIKTLHAAVVGAAVAVVKFVHDSTRELNALTYAAQMAGTSAKSLREFANVMETVGGNTQEAYQAAIQFNQELLRSPWIKGTAETLAGGPFKDAPELFEKLAGQLHTLETQFGKGNYQVTQFLQNVEEQLHIPGKLIQQIANNWEEHAKSIAHNARLTGVLGDNLKRAGEQALATTNALTRFGQTISSYFQIISQFVIQDLADAFEFLDDLLLDATPTLKRWMDWLQKTHDEYKEGFKNWVQDLKRIYREGGWEAVGAEVGRVILEALEIGPTEEDIKKWIDEVAIPFIHIGEVAAENFINGLEDKLLESAPDWLRKLIRGTEATLNTAAGIPLSPAQQEPTFVPGSPSYQAPQTSPERSWLWDQIKGAFGFQKGGIVNANLHHGEMVLPQHISSGIQGFFGGGGASSLDVFQELKDGFDQWWNGDTSFRPMVDFVPDVYAHLEEMLRDLGMSAPGGGGGGDGAGGPGGGAGGGAAGEGGGQAVPNIEGMTAQERNMLGLIMKYESSGRNIMNSVGQRMGLDPNTAKGYTAQGYFQILNSNWRQIAPQLGIAATNAMSASLEEQTKVALALLRRGGGRDWLNYNAKLRAAVAAGEQIGEGGGVPMVSGGGPGGNMAGGAAGTTSGRFSGGRVNLAAVNQALVQTLQAASDQLPEGYRVVATSGARVGGLEHSQHHGGGALDVQIIGPDGKPVTNRGQDTSGMYTRLAHEWYQQVMKLYPHLGDRAAWGGEFGVTPGSPVADLMHFDFGGRRGHLRGGGNWKYLNSNQTVNIHVHGHDAKDVADQVADRQAASSRQLTRNLRPFVHA